MSYQEQYDYLQSVYAIYDKIVDRIFFDEEDWEDGVRDPKWVKNAATLLYDVYEELKKDSHADINSVSKLLSQVKKILKNNLSNAKKLFYKYTILDNMQDSAVEEFSLKHKNKFKKFVEKKIKYVKKAKSIEELSAFIDTYDNVIENEILDYSLKVELLEDGKEDLKELREDVIEDIKDMEFWPVKPLCSVCVFFALYIAGLFQEFSVFKLLWAIIVTVVGLIAVVCCVVITLVSLPIWLIGFIFSHIKVILIALLIIVVVIVIILIIIGSIVGG